MFACLKGGAGLQSIDLLKSIDEAAATAAESALVHQRPSKACYATAEGAYVMAPWGTKKGTVGRRRTRTRRRFLRSTADEVTKGGRWIGHSQR